MLKTGGGSKRHGLGKGIHWHIENQVYYLPTDPEEQDIPFVRVVNDDGSVTDYIEVGSRDRSGRGAAGRSEGDGLHHLPQPHHPPGLSAGGHGRPAAGAGVDLGPDPGDPTQGRGGATRHLSDDREAAEQGIAALDDYLPAPPTRIITAREHADHVEQAIEAICRPRTATASSSTRRSTGTRTPTTSAT